MWSAVAAKASTVTWLPGAGLRELARDVPDLALGSSMRWSSKRAAIPHWRKCWGHARSDRGSRRSCFISPRLMGFEESDDRTSIFVAAAFTHAEIANLIGSTRQWVTISLNRFQAAGILTQRRGMLVIKRLDLLSAAASSE